MGLVLCGQPLRLLPGAWVLPGLSAGTTERTDLVGRLWTTGVAFWSVAADKRSIPHCLHCVIPPHWPATVVDTIDGHRSCRFNH